jgi:hypothetical protein
LTVKAVVVDPAAKLPEAAWLQVTVTCPLPVGVSIFPEIVAGPLAIA